MEEKALTAKKSGFSMLPLCFIVFASGAALFVYAIGHLERGENALGGFLLVVAILGYIAGIIALPGFKGWQAETGFTGRDMMRADVVNAVLEKHCEAIILSDSSKFSAVHPYPLGPAGRFNRVITDDRLPDACREQLLRSGLTVDIVPYI